MILPPFPLNQWLAQHHLPGASIAYDLASSTGPHWSLAELAALGDPLDLSDTPLTYSSPEGSKPLREAIAAFHGVDPDWVIATTGGSEALLILLCLLERPGAHLLIPDPAYPAYAAMAQAWRLATRAYPLSPADNFAHHPNAILAAATEHTAAVLVNTPHNPTGAVMPAAQIAELAAALAVRKTPLIVDEVYHPLYFTTPQPSAATLGNVIVTSDLSKALSLPGLRTGWIITADPVLRARIIDARSYFSISGSPLLERLATHALTHRSAILGRLQAAATANLAALTAMMAKAASPLAWAPPAGGTTAFPWFTDRPSSRSFCETLAQAGVLLAPGDCFDHPAHLRIGFAQQEHDFQAALHIVAQHLHRLA